MGQYFEQTEVVLAEVTITTRLFAESEDAAKKMFDDGEWEVRREEIGDIRSTLSSDIHPWKGKF